MAAKTSRKKAAKKATKKVAAKKAPAKPAPRADKGEGEAAVRARIAALAEPSRSIMTKLHPLIVKHGKGLSPVVRWGFAVYKKGDTMVLVAAPRKKYVSFGFTMDAQQGNESLDFASAADVDEAKVKAIVKRALA
jgi:hypothetical protein